MMNKILEASSFIQSKIKNKPKIGIVLGSGLGIYVDQIQNKTIIPYQDIPHFKRTSVEGHQGALIVGEVHGITVAALQGRLHAYEGHPMEEIVLPVRVLAALGIEILFLTNASGGINLNFHPGDLVTIQDHINLSGRNPLQGPNISDLGPRFPDMSEAYDSGLIQILHSVAKNHHVKLMEHAAGVITINSTVGFEAMKLKKNVGIAGNAFYGIDGLVGKLNTPEEVAAFFEMSLAHQEVFDGELLQKFFDYYLYEYQVLGNMFNPLPETFQEVEQRFFRPDMQ
jgi:inosine/guanosine/xanthosine phosphorylase family protein